MGAMGASPRLALSTDRAASRLPTSDWPLTNPVALSPTQQFSNGLLRRRWRTLRDHRTGRQSRRRAECLRSRCRRACCGGWPKARAEPCRGCYPACHEPAHHFVRGPIGYRLGKQIARPIARHSRHWIDSGGPTRSAPGRLCASDGRRVRFVSLGGAIGCRGPVGLWCVGLWCVGIWCVGV